MEYVQDAVSNDDYQDVIRQCNQMRGKAREAELELISTQTILGEKIAKLEARVKSERKQQKELSRLEDIVSNHRNNSADLDMKLDEATKELAYSGFATPREVRWGRDRCLDSKRKLQEELAAREETFALCEARQYAKQMPRSKSSRTRCPSCAPSSSVFVVTSRKNGKHTTNCTRTSSTR